MKSNGLVSGSVQNAGRVWSGSGSIGIGMDARCARNGFQNCVEHERGGNEKWHCSDMRASQLKSGRDSFDNPFDLSDETLEKSAN